MNPATYIIDADLSREDLLVLHTECFGKDVVEFGSGGSTLYLAQIARSLRSFETDPEWFRRVSGALARAGHSPDTVTLLDPGQLVVPAPSLPPADVYFIDGVSQGRCRARWVETVMLGALAPTILLHDSRRDYPTNDLGIFTWPMTAMLRTVHFHHGNSNFIVIRLRDEPVVYRNWNEEEPRASRARFGEGRPA